MAETVFFGDDREALDREYDFAIIMELADPGMPLSRAILRQMGLP